MFSLFLHSIRRCYDHASPHNALLARAYTALRTCAYTALRTRACTAFRTCGLLLLLPLALVSCGGGGGGFIPSLPAPLLTNVEETLTFTAGAAIETVILPNTGGDLSIITECSVSKNLPDGLMVRLSGNIGSIQACRITGTPIAPTTGTVTVTITATGGSGSSTATVKIRVTNGAPVPELGNAAAANLVVGTAIKPIIFPNTGGIVSSASSGCTASATLPAGLMATLFSGSGTRTCQIVGTPEVRTSGAVTVTVTATNGSGSATATVAITVVLPPPVVADIDGLRVYFVGQTGRTINLTNTGGGALSALDATVPGCAVDTALPSGLELAISADNQSCLITGSPDAPSAETAYTVTTTNADGADTAAVNILVLGAPAGDPALADIDGVQTYIAGTLIAPIAFANSGSPPLSCLAKAEVPLPAGLFFTATIDGASCRLVGTPVTQTASALYTLVARGASGADDEATITINVLAAGTTLAAPDLPDTAVAVDAVANIALPTLAIANTGGPIASCAFVDSSQDPVVLTSALNAPVALTVTAAADGSTCDINGILTGTAPQSLTVRATNITGTDDADVNFTIISSSLPALDATDTEIDADYNVSLSAPVVITNTNKEARAAITANSCVLVDEGGDKLTPVTPASDADDTAVQYELNGLVLSTMATTDLVAGTCVITGTPATAGRNVLRVRADTDEGSSAVLALTFIVRQIDTLRFEAASINKVAGDVPFTNPVTAASRTTAITWSSGDTAVATVDANTGEVTILTTGTIAITATRAQDDAYKAVSADYSLAVKSVPPDLPDTITFAVVSGVDIGTRTITANAGSVDISACAFINAGAETLSLDGISIAKTADSRGCAITGVLTGVGAKPYTVRARAVAGLVEVAVIFNVSAATVAQLDRTTLEFDADFGVLLPPVVIANTNTDRLAVLADGNCVLVDALGAKLAPAPTPANAYTFNGFVLSTVAAACQITGTPNTAGRNVLRLRADTSEGSSPVLVLTFIVRQDNALSFTSDTITKAVGDAPFTNDVISVDTAAVITWVSADPAVATIDSATGAVTTKAVGTIDITANSAQNDKYKSASATYSLKVNPQIPILQTLPDQILATGALVSFSLTNTGGSLNALGAMTPGCNINKELPIGLRLIVADDFSTCTVTGTPSTVQNAIDYTIAAANVSGSAETTFNITVVSGTPTIAVIPPLTFTAGVEITPQPFANTNTHSDAGSVTACVATVGTPLPPGLTIAAQPAPGTLNPVGPVGDGCFLSGTPMAFTAQAVYSITVTNSNGASTLELDITVNPAAPDLADLAAQNLPTGAPINLTFTNNGGAMLYADGAPTPGCALTTGALPQGLELNVSADKSTCVLSGTPTMAQTAADITITATNISGDSTATVSLAIVAGVAAFAMPEALVFTDGVDIGTSHT
ncbi:MAG: putative Ig domain-containing protein, partial [Proteobacteria bacterium]|nr:putative Ig domain-containing protein [Pseudomonadota bacterium]